MTKNYVLPLVVFGFYSLSVGATLGAGVFQEKDGLLVMEAESAQAVKGWVSETTPEGFTGASFYKCTVNAFGKPTAELIYRFNITSPGTYKLLLHSRKPGIGRDDEANDCWTKLVGYVGFRGSYTKTFLSGKQDLWGWAGTHVMPDHTLVGAFYTLDAGEYEFRIAARSKDYMVDRIVLYDHTSVSVATARDLGNAESSTAPMPARAAKGKRVLRAKVSGELRQWHKVTIAFTGPFTSESAKTNPFLNYRLNVTFTQKSKTYVVPGYYCADGNAANSEADTGNKWRVHFSPPTTGTWKYRASFRTGADVAISSGASAGSPTGFDGVSGSFDVSATNKSGDDFRGKGLLRLPRGKFHLRFSGTGQYWIKGGTDSPEDLLGCRAFDNTISRSEFKLTRYVKHFGDWNPGDPVWRSGKGKGIIGALNYLGSQKVNSVYFLPMNLGGDGKNTHPFATMNSKLRYDCSKLDQWGIVFDHAQRKGILLQMVLNEAEAENRNWLDKGKLGRERKLFYRELIARFAHVNGLMWNICEEGIASFRPPTIMKSFADYVRSVDPYNHPIGVHNWIKEDGIDAVFADFYGHPSIDYLSIQYRSSYVREDYRDPRISKLLGDLRAGTARAGKPLALMSDEFERALPIDDESCRLGIFATGGMQWHRKAHVWQWYLGGGAGVEYILDNLLNTDDFRLYEPLWRYTRYARNFMDQIPFGDMVPSHNLLTGESNYEKSNPTISGVVLAKPGEIYAIQLPNATRTGTLNMSNAPGTFTQRWYNPRTGNFEGTTKRITGGGKVALGAPPSSSKEDWVVLIEKTGSTPPNAPAK